MHLLKATINQRHIVNTQQKILKKSFNFLDIKNNLHGVNSVGAKTALHSKSSRQQIKQRLHLNSWA